MKSSLRIALSLLLTQVACTTSIDESRPLAYRCDPAEENSCPEDWICGLDRYCLNPAFPGPYRCVADSDCVGGWECTSAGQCLNPAFPPEGLACQTNADCVGGYQCGPGLSCYDRTRATSVPCRLDGGEGALDCRDGWRCGIDEVCHDTAVGDAYPCGVDTDCEQGWRCGSEGACVNIAREGLRPSGALSVERVTGAYLQPGVTAMGMGDAPCLFEDQGECVEVSLYAFADPTGVTVLANFYLEAEGNNFTAQRVRFPNAIDVAVYDDRVLIASSSSVSSYRWARAGGQLESLPASPVNPIRALRVLGKDKPVLAALGDTGVALLPLDSSGGWQLGPVPGSMLADLNELDDLEAQSDTDTVLIAATDQGLFAAARTGSTFPPSAGPAPTWVPVSLPSLSNVACGGAAPFAPGSAMRMKSSEDPYYDGTFITVLESVQNPVTREGGKVHMFSRDPGLTPASACGDWGFVSYGPCEACPPGQRLKWSAPYELESLGYEFEATTRCEELPLGGGDPIERSYKVIGYSDGTCEAPAPVYFAGNEGPRTVFAHGNPEAPGFVEQNGQLFYSYSSGTQFDSIFLGHAPEFYFARAEGVDALVSGSGATYRVVPGIGVVFENAGYNSRPKLCGPMQDVTPFALHLEKFAETPTGTRELMLSESTAFLAATSSGDVPAANRFRLVDSSELTQLGSTPYTTNAITGVSTYVASCKTVAAQNLRYTEVRPAAGEPLWVLSVADRFWADFMNRSAEEEVPEVPLRGLPVPFGSISSLALGPSPKPGHLVSGYLTVGNRLFDVSASTIDRWSTRERTLPVEDLYGAWMDGERGRVLAPDGRVFTLPGGVQVAAALPELMPEVLSLHEVCGQAYVASRSNKLYRLEALPDGRGGGEWVPVHALVDALPSGETLLDATYFSAPEGLMVILASGTILRIEDSSCGP